MKKPLPLPPVIIVRPSSTHPTSKTSAPKAGEGISSEYVGTCSLPKKAIGVHGGEQGAFMAHIHLASDDKRFDTKFQVTRASGSPLLVFEVCDMINGEKRPMTEAEVERLNNHFSTATGLKIQGFTNYDNKGVAAFKSIRTELLSTFREQKRTTTAAALS